MNKPQNSLVQYIHAINNNNVAKAAQVLEKEIQNIDRNNKEELVSCIKQLVQLLFQLKKYDNIIKECNKLRSVGYDIEDDEELLLLEAESYYRVDSKKVADRFGFISEKFQSDKAKAARERIESNLNNIYDKENVNSGRSCKRKRN